MFWNIKCDSNKCDKGKPTVRLGRKAMGLQYEECQVTKYLNDMTEPTGHIKMQVKLRHSSCA